MASNKQCSDYAQTGPGTKVTSVTPKGPRVSVPVSNGTSGESQGVSRGKQGMK